MCDDEDKARLGRFCRIRICQIKDTSSLSDSRKIWKPRCSRFEQVSPGGVQDVLTLAIVDIAWSVVPFLSLLWRICCRRCRVPHLLSPPQAVFFYTFTVPACYICRVIRLAVGYSPKIRRVVPWLMSVRCSRGRRLACMREQTSQRCLL